MKSATRHLHFPLPFSKGPTPTAVLVRRELRAIAERMQAKSIGWNAHSCTWIDGEGLPRIAWWSIEANVTMAIGRVEIARVVKPTLDEALRTLLGELYAMEWAS